MELIAKAARSLPHSEVESALQPLMLDDDYEVRRGLSELISRRREEGRMASSRRFTLPGRSVDRS
jgi:hypothetical protein